MLTAEGRIAWRRQIREKVAGPVGSWGFGLGAGQDILV